MGRIYIILGAIAAGILAMFVAFQKGAAAGRDKVVAVVTKKTLKQQQKATKAMVDGLANENKVRNEKPDPNKPNRFTKQ